MINNNPYIFKTLKDAFESMKAQYDSKLHYDITVEEFNGTLEVVIKVWDDNDNEVGYLEDV